MQKLKFAGLYLISRSNVTNALAEIRKIGWGILAAFLVGILLLILLVYYLMHILYGKFAQILSVMDRVAQGNFPVRVPKKEVINQD